MEKLTDRQVGLIKDLLNTYQFFCTECKFRKEETKPFIFNNFTYRIWEADYKQVCEIIDYIKGVKKDGNS